MTSLDRRYNKGITPLLLLVFLITMIVVGYFFWSRFYAQESDTQSNASEVDVYESNRFQMTATYPANWSIYEQTQEQIGQESFINIYDPRAEREPPFGLHSYPHVTHVTLYPGGIATENPNGTRTSFAQATTIPTPSFPINEEQSTVYYLNDGTIWGYTIVPSLPPSHPWSSAYIVAQARIQDFSATCYDQDTDERISMDVCDPLTGDQVEYAGEVLDHDREELIRILEHMELKGNIAGEEMTDGVTITTPSPQETITSPVTVAGEAPQAWFAGNTHVTIQIRDENGMPINQVQTSVQSIEGDQPVSFQEEVRFSLPNDGTEGSIVIENVPASGFSNERYEHVIPVQLSI